LSASPLPAVQKFLINCINGAVLVVLLIGVPAATRARFGRWEIGDEPTSLMVMLWGFGLAVLGNLLGATVLIKDRKGQELCARWTFVFAGFWLFEFALFRGWINFNWLKNSLLWLQKHL
jgi:hypothetical protein